MKEETLRVQNLTKKYVSGLIKTQETIGARNVSFKLDTREVISIVGESGSGKSTVANLILRFLYPTEGEIYYRGKTIYDIPTKEYYKDKEFFKILIVLLIISIKSITF